MTGVCKEEQAPFFSRMLAGHSLEEAMSNSILTIKMVFKTKHSINFDSTMIHALLSKTLLLFFESINFSSHLPVFPNWRKGVNCNTTPFGP